MAVHNAWSTNFDQTGFGGLNRPFPIQGFANGIDHTTHKPFPHRNFGNPPGPFDRITLTNTGTSPKERNPDTIFFKVQYLTEYAPWKFQEFARHGSFQSIYFGDVITDLNHIAHFIHVNPLVKPFNFFLDDGADFFCFDLHGLPLRQLILHAGQSTQHGIIKNLTANVYFQSGYESRFDFKHGINFFTKPLGELAFYLFLFSDIYRLCGTDSDLLNPLLLIG